VIRLNTLDDVTNLSESVDVECKLAAGADGKGRLPREFWPTYSAFANTRGGVILLGVREDSGRFTLHGVDEADRVITDLFNTVNNPDKVSINLLADTHVRRLTVDVDCGRGTLRGAQAKTGVSERQSASGQYLSTPA
jgi:ATP-dependent DNA helicase RecG